MMAVLARSRQSDTLQPEKSGATAFACCLFRTELGWIALAWRGELVRGLTFGHVSNSAAFSALVRQLQGVEGEGASDQEWSQPRRLPAFISQARQALIAYAQGQPQELGQVPLDLERLTDFQKKVVRACQAIPYGEVRSYGQLAGQVGHPGAARAVGTVMSSNRFPLLVPCHRVIGSGGALGGYSAPEGLSMKRRLLALERGAKQA